MDGWTDCEINRDKGRSKGDRDAAGGVAIEPGDDVRTYHCCGLNGRILLATILNPESHDCLRDIKHSFAAWRSLLPPSSADVYTYTHGTRCKRGKHRSVACLELAGHCFRKTGIDNSIQHLDMANCGCPLSCSNVGRLEGGELLREQWLADGKRAMTMALDVWRAL